MYTLYPTDSNASNTGNQSQTFLQTTDGSGQILVTLTNEQLASLSDETNTQPDVKSFVVSSPTKQTIPDQPIKRGHPRGDHRILKYFEKIEIQKGSEDLAQCDVRVDSSEVISSEKVEGSTVHCQSINQGTSETVSVITKSEEKVKAENSEKVGSQDSLVPHEEVTGVFYPVEVSTSSQQVVLGQDGATSGEKKVLRMADSDTEASPILSIVGSPHPAYRQEQVVIPQGQQIEVRGPFGLILLNVYIVTCQKGGVCNKLPHKWPQFPKKLNKIKLIKSKDDKVFNLI